MSRRQTEKKNRGTLWILLLILLLCLLVGGVSAYLSMYASGTSNTLTKASQPAVTVSGKTVVVDTKGYAVYLRVAVDADYQQDGMVMPGEPAVTFTTGEDWIAQDGFYYYTTPLEGGLVPVILPVSVSEASDAGYTVKLNVAAQVVQAVGTLDGSTVTAVEDAWGITLNNS